MCLDGTCVCNDGYTGDDCSDKLCDAGCNGRGDCQVDGTCACYDGWGGADCAEPNLVRECDRCKGKLDCYGDSCECFPYPDRDCNSLVATYGGGAMMKSMLVSIFVLALTVLF
mmetsp:Transcript_3489/g.3050  ORF Transcript_3489/g.3050 Transcript_3489/m.3050 type:complete len:113 (+) Transcript_3489:80-418(+)